MRRDDENIYTISTHTPLARRDVVVGGAIYSAYEFLLTRLLRGATIGDFTLMSRICISTHTPLARRDMCILSTTRLPELFLLTRLLRGATNDMCCIYADHGISTHTPLARRDTQKKIDHYQIQISTHTPLARRDEQPILNREIYAHFYSHASCEARPRISRSCGRRTSFLLTRLLRGAPWMSI